MDADGVDVEVLYSEVSGFRYLYLMGSVEAGNAATRAFNDALDGLVAPTPSASSSRTSSRSTTSTPRSRRSSASRRSAASRCSSRCSRPSSACPTTIDERYDPLWSVDHRDRPADLLPHRAQHVAQRPRASATPRRRAGSWCRWSLIDHAEAFGMWIIGGVLERFPDLKLVFVETGLGWVPWYLYIVDDLATRQRYEFPAITELPSFYFHRNVHLTFIDDPWVRDRRPLRRSASTTSCGRPTTRTRCRAGRTRSRSSRSSSPASPTTSASSSSAATPRACGTLNQINTTRGGIRRGVSVEKSRSSPVPRTESGRRRRGSSQSSARPWWWPTSTRRTGRPSPVSWATRARSRSSTSPASPATSSSTTRRSRSRVGSTSCT